MLVLAFLVVSWASLSCATPQPMFGRMAWPQHCTQGYHRYHGQHPYYSRIQGGNFDNTGRMGSYQYMDFPGTGQFNNGGPMFGGLQHGGNFHNFYPSQQMYYNNNMGGLGPNFMGQGTMQFQTIDNYPGLEQSVWNQPFVGGQMNSGNVGGTGSFGTSFVEPHKMNLDLQSHR